MTTVSAGPPLGEEAILQDLTQPPEIAPLKTLDGLRTEARNLTEEKILTLPQLNQATLLAGTGITPTRNTTSQRHMEITFIIKDSPHLVPTLSKG
jgi:hypothetical protein